MGTITVNVKDDVEKDFRKLVRSVHGARKGELGKVLTEAMKKWVYESEPEKRKICADLAADCWKRKREFAVSVQNLSEFYVPKFPKN